MTTGEFDALATTLYDVDDLTAVLASVGLDSFLDELIAAIRDGAARFDPERTEHKIRAGFSYMDPEAGLVEWMPIHQVGDAVAVKTVGYHPENPARRGVPSVLATIALYDTTTGHLRALCEGTLLTALRTGAASAVATDVMARRGPITLGLVGCGAQAITQVHAISRIRPIARLVATDTDPEVASTFVDRLPPVTSRVELVDTEAFEAAVPELDVLVTCTSVPIGAGPVVAVQGYKPDLHVNAVGADFPGKTELPLDFVRRSLVVPDDLEQCLVEGESQRLDRSELGPDLAGLLADHDPDRHADRLTLFDSTGWSFEDLMAAELFIAHADRLGLGTSVALQQTPGDPYDPYAGLRTASPAIWRPVDESAAS